MIDSKKQLFLILDSMEDFQRSLIEKGGMTNESWELLDGLEKVIAETKHHRNDIEMQAWQKSKELLETLRAHQSV
jgi:hypothetical protein